MQIDLGCLKTVFSEETPVSKTFLNNFLCSKTHLVADGYVKNDSRLVWFVGWFGSRHPKGSAPTERRFRPHAFCLNPPSQQHSRGV